MTCNRVDIEDAEVEFINLDLVLDICAIVATDASDQGRAVRSDAICYLIDRAVGHSRRCRLAYIAARDCLEGVDSE